MPAIERRDEPGAWFHVTNRALGRRPLFENRAEVRFFLSLLARAVRRGWIEVHAFTVLATHFHLLVRSLTGELHRAMAWIQSRYVLRFNRLHDRDGPLVRGRFRSKRVSDDDYRRLVVGYIDWNPVVAGFARTPLQHEHGSAVRLLGRRRPRWLATDWVSSQLGGLPGQRPDPDAYLRVFGPSPRQLEIVEYRLLHDNPDCSTPNLVAASGPAVAGWLRRRARIADGNPQRRNPLVPPDRIREAVDRIQAHTVPHRSRRSADPRPALLAGLLRDLAGLGLREIGGRIGVSSQRAHALAVRHRGHLAADDDYLDFCSGLTRELLRATYIG
jgi:REP element-mobilizing transposase RayT